MPWRHMTSHYRSGSHIMLLNVNYFKIASYIVWCRLTSHDVMWRHLMSCYIVWRHMTSRDVMHDVIWHHMTSMPSHYRPGSRIMLLNLNYFKIASYIVWCQLTPHDVMWRHLMSCYILWRHMTSRDVIWRHVLYVTSIQYRISKVSFTTLTLGYLTQWHWPMNLSKILSKCTPCHILAERMLTDG